MNHTIARLAVVAHDHDRADRPQGQQPPPPPPTAKEHPELPIRLPGASL
ncbi:hypothetical protein ACWDSL_06560 [Streptomyces sp. NPDC000941]